MNREQRRALAREKRKQQREKKRMADSLQGVIKQLACKRMLERLKELEEEENGTATTENN